MRAVRGLELGGLRGNEVSMSLALYKTGYRAELRAKKILEGWGFKVVRSARSGGPFDLVGWNEVRFTLVQVKVCPTGKLPSFNRLKKKLAKIPVPANCKKELWIWERRKGFHYMPI